LDSSKGYVWRTRGEYNESTLATTEKVPGFVLVFAAIGSNLKSNLVLIKGTVDANNYQGILNESNVFTIADEMYGKNNYFLCKMKSHVIQLHKTSSEFIRNANSCFYGQLTVQILV
jgi:hypothetical protein